MQTFTEAGVPGFEIRPGTRCSRRARTREIVNRLSEQVIATVNQPDFRATLASRAPTRCVNSAELGAFLRTSTRANADIINARQREVDP